MMGTFGDAWRAAKKRKAPEPPPAKVSGARTYGELADIVETAETQRHRGGFVSILLSRAHRRELIEALRIAAGDPPRVLASELTP